MIFKTYMWMKDYHEECDLADNKIRCFEWENVRIDAQY